MFFNIFKKKEVIIPTYNHSFKENPYSPPWERTFICTVCGTERDGYDYEWSTENIKMCESIECKRDRILEKLINK